MTIYTYWFTQSVLLLFFAFGLGSSVATVVSGRLRRQLDNGKLTGGSGGVGLKIKRLALIITGERVTRQTTKAWLVLLGMVVGFGWGFGYRDHLLIVSQITYKHVYVQQKVSDARYYMRPAYMRPIDSELCPGARVDWREGETLADWTFEQLHGCKRVISYHRYMRGETNVEVSLR